MNRYRRFNERLAVRLTNAVGSMTCAYVFAGLALVSLPAAIGAGTAALVQWIAQTFLQLVLLSVILVGQNVAQDQADTRHAAQMAAHRRTHRQTAGR